MPWCTLHKCADTSPNSKVDFPQSLNPSKSGADAADAKSHPLTL